MEIYLFIQEISSKFNMFLWNENITEKFKQKLFIQIQYQSYLGTANLVKNNKSI